MKIVIAPDSFKESLSAPDVAEAIARGWRRVFPQAEVLLRPLADGGEGTVDAVLAATAGERRECRVEGPLGEPTLAHWGWLDDATAVIEMASASGLHLVPRDRRDATRSSSRGTGELIRAALDAGARKIILGLGGSATNDAGAGLLSALGVRFLAADGEELAPGGAAGWPAQSRPGRAGSAPGGCRGGSRRRRRQPAMRPRGASAVFGPQKGASAEQVAQLDAALAHFAKVVAATLGEDFSRVPGVGAAGGLGFAARAFLRARFRPGIELVAELAGLADALVGADLVLTGEGRLDAQSLHGKTRWAWRGSRARPAFPW